MHLVRTVSHVPCTVEQVSRVPACATTSFICNQLHSHGVQAWYIYNNKGEAPCVACVELTRRPVVQLAARPEGVPHH